MNHLGLAPMITQSDSVQDIRVLGYLRRRNLTNLDFFPSYGALRRTSGKRHHCVGSLRCEAQLDQKSGSCIAFRNSQQRLDSDKPLRSRPYGGINVCLWLSETKRESVSCLWPKFKIQSNVCRWPPVAKLPMQTVYQVRYLLPFWVFYSCIRTRSTDQG